SLSDYQSLDSIRLEWMDLKEDIQGIKADVEMTIESQVGDIQGAIKLDHFFRSPASATPPTHDYRYEHQSHSGQSGDQYYEDQRSVPAIFIWYRKILRFKDNSPILFYSLIFFVLFVIIIVTAISGLRKT
ncbi:MAG: hypothetical protein MI864_20390, partial [Pseudomonadales bacterium]|nr:hypothetical protein [Pseudomonadales bacterium]